jgi:ubiquinone biosynthesis protein UbiJ
MLVATPLLSLEMLINRHIQASTPARALLERLQGRSFAIAFAGQGRTVLRVHLAAHREGLRITLDHDLPADANVRGSPASLIRLVAGRAQGGSHQAGVTVEGDATVVQGFEHLFQHARPDVDAELARLIGDQSAHYALKAARQALASGRRVLESLTRSTSEYLVEEGRDVVGRAELAAFHDDVDDLRDDVARFEARLARMTPRAEVRS